MSKRSHKVSFSQYKLFKKCPLAYKYQYIDKIGEFKKNIYLIFGAAVHDTVQCYLYLLYNAKTMEPDAEVNGIKIADYLIKEGDSYTGFDTDQLLKDRMYHEVADIDEEVREDRVTKEELLEFYQDGVAILDYLKRKRKDWFTINGWELVGIEFKLDKQLHENLDFVGYIDILLKDNTGKYHVIDLKTSTKGWGYFQKNDTVSTNQNLLYKKLLSEKLNIPLKKINVEYLVLKRKVENLEGVPEAKRLQRFIPTNGTISVHKATEDFYNFVDYVFDEGNRDETQEYPSDPDKFSCKFCEFNDICPDVHEDAK